MDAHFFHKHNGLSRRIGHYRRAAIPKVVERETARPDGVYLPHQLALIVMETKDTDSLITTGGEMIGM